MDYEKMRRKNKSTRKCQKIKYGSVCRFFNYTSNDIKSYEVNLLQIVSYTLISGIIGINTGFAIFMML